MIDHKLLPEASRGARQTGGGGEGEEEEERENAHRAPAGVLRWLEHSRVSRQGKGTIHDL